MSASQINLTWTDNSNNESGFTVERALLSTGPWTQVATTTANVTSWANSGLSASTLYFYHVMSFNSGGNSGNSNMASATTSAAADTTPPTVPTGLIATAVSSSQIDLSWSASTDSGGSGLAGYKAYQSGTLVGSTAATSYSRTGLAASTQYCYTVAAYDNAGNVSGQSTQACATTQAGSSGAFQWSKAMGSTGDDRLFAMAVDTSGNILTTGHYVGTVDFAGGGGDSSSIHTSLAYLGNYSKDIFLAKYDSAGRHLWSKSFGTDFGVGADVEAGQALAVDASGNIYLAGKTANGINVRYINFGCANTDYQGSGLNAFVVKLNAQGQCQWARSIGDDYDDVANGLAVDGSGNVYMTGYFQNTANFNGGNPWSTADAFTRTAVDQDGYIVKYNSSGATQWVRRFGGTLLGASSQGTSMSIDRTDNGVVLTGSFYSSATFEDIDGLKKLPMTSAGGRDGLVVKYSSTGQLLWAIPVGTAGADSMTASAVDGSGNVWVTGLLNGQLYAAKYLGSNRQLAWPAKYFASGSVSSGNSISLDTSGTATIGGYVNATVDFGGGPLTPQQADTFAVQYNASGAYVTGSGKLYGGGGYQFGMVAVTGSGERVLAGHFPDFATLGSNAYSSAGNMDIFIAKFAP
jgi:hypothetical protein